MHASHQPDSLSDAAMSSLSMVIGLPPVMSKLWIRLLGFRRGMAVCSGLRGDV